MRQDQRVYYRSASLIALDAQALRAESGLGLVAHFNIVDFIQGPLTVWLLEHGRGELKIRFFDAAEGEDIAFVTFRPILTLNVDNDVWRSALLGDPSSRYVLAHEIGHLVLHYYYDLAFSTDPSLRTKPFNDEEKAEWQANTFADFFLLPDAIVRSIRADLDRRCGVSPALAAKREAAVFPKRKPNLSAAFCGDCGGFLLMRDGVPDRCGCGQGRGTRSTVTG